MFPRMVTVGLVYDYCVKESWDVGADFVAGRISFFSQGLEFRRRWQGPVAYRRLQEHKNIVQIDSTASSANQWGYVDYVGITYCQICRFAKFASTDFPEKLSFPGRRQLSSPVRTTLRCKS